MTFNFVRYRKLYYIFSGVLIVASLASLFLYRLNFGIDFTGGSIMELEYQGDMPSVEQAREKLTDFGEISLQKIGEAGLILRMKDISEEDHQLILSALIEGYQAQEKKFESIGPVIGQELKKKTIVLMAVSLLAIVLYIVMAFRKVQRPIKSWKYALASLVSLFHDLLIPLGVFSILGKFYGVEISIPVVTAFLTVGGSSINNVIVVFDRIRENIIRRNVVTFEDTVNKSINETMGRCLNTSFCYLLPLFAIFFFGGDTLRYFSLALILGIIAGTYSASFLASPLLVSWLKKA